MLTDPLIVIGAGGHGKVVVDALLSIGVKPSGIRIADDDPNRAGLLLVGVPVIGPLAECLHPGARFHVAIGQNRIRERLASVCERAGLIAITVRHPSATVSPSAHVGDGTLVAAGAVIGPDATVGSHCIVNHGCVIDHDCRVGTCSHIAPNATLGGATVVGNRVLIGAGATVLPGVMIGDDCTIGAGAVVLHNLPPGSTFAGVPAQRIDRKAS